MLALPISAPSAESSGFVGFIEGCVGEVHVAFGAVGEWVGAFLKDAEGG